MTDEAKKAVNEMLKRRAVDLLVAFALLMVIGLVLGSCSSAQADELYNPMTGQWETVDPGEDSLRYNPMDNSWSYEDDDAELQYQPMQDRWEYVEPDRNPYPSKWW